MTLLRASLQISCVAIAVLLLATGRIQSSTHSTESTLRPAEPPNLRDAIWAEYQARTNTPANWYWIWDGFTWGGKVDVRGWIWNTNSIFYRSNVLARGATAISPANQSSGTQRKFTLLTRRHALTAGHYWETNAVRLSTKDGLVGTQIWFIGTNNFIHTATVARISVNLDPDDLALVIFKSDVPGDVQPMRIPTADGLYGMAAVQSRTGRIYWPPALFSCQHGYVVSSPPHNFISGGDSGGTLCVLMANEAWFCSSGSSRITTNLFQRINELTVAEGLDTNKYQPATVDISNWPPYQR